MVNFTHLQTFANDNSWSVVATGNNGTLLACELFPWNEGVRIYELRNGTVNKSRHQIKLRNLGIWDWITNGLERRYVCDIAMTVDGNYIVARSGIVEIYSSTFRFERILYKWPYKYDTTGWISVGVFPDGRIILCDSGRRVLVTKSCNGEADSVMSVCGEHPVGLAILDETRVAVAALSENLWHVYVYDLQSRGRVVTIKVGCKSICGLCHHKGTDSILVSMNVCDQIHNVWRLDSITLCNTHKSVVRQYCIDTGELLAQFELGDTSAFITCVSMPMSGNRANEDVLAVSFWDQGIKTYKITHNHDADHQLPRVGDGTKCMYDLQREVVASIQAREWFVFVCGVGAMVMFRGIRRKYLGW